MPGTNMILSALLCTAVVGLGGSRASAQLTPPADVLITGETPDDDFGWSVAPAGDVNADGVQDLVVGAPSNDAVAGFAGRAYLFHGPITGDLDAADAAAVISAEAFGDNLGFAVSSAGDVNADGFDDLLIGARSNDTAGIQAGRVYLFLGPVNGALDAVEAAAIISGEAFDELGRAVAPAGDVNGDGFGDIILGAPLAGDALEGAAWLFFGPLAGLYEAADADAIFTGILFSESFGTSVASAGDLNDDGLSDLIIGAPRFPLDGNDTGRAYIFFSPVEGEMSAADADVTLFGEGLNDGFGTSVAPAGDINGDGLDDVVVGADQLFTVGTGRAYGFYGPLSGDVQAADADAILVGEALDDLFGTSVSGAGDVNGDGAADLIVGASGAAGQSGRAYFFQGPIVGTIAAADADLTVTGGSADQLGLAVAGAGDLDGDGLGDVIIGAPQLTNGDPGYAAVYFGVDGAGADLALSVTPVDPPVEIPAEGGSFRYRFELVNNGDVELPVDIWVVVSGPGVERTVGPFSRTLPAGGRIGRIFRLGIPGGAPAGRYRLRGHAGTFPVADVSDGFAFEKLAEAAAVFDVLGQ